MTQPVVRSRSRLVPVLGGLAMLIVGVLYVVQHQSESAQSSGSSQDRELSESARLGIGLQSGAKGAASVHGHVLDDSGQAVSGARVCVACANCAARSALHARCTLSQPDGAFALAALGADAYVVSAQATGFVTGYAQDGEPLQAWQSHEPLVLRLKAGAENVAGMVIDALGGPVAQARVQLIRFVDGLTPTLEVITDEEGRFAATLPEGHVTLRAESPGYAPTMRSYVAPTQDIVLALTPESVVRGVVQEAGTGKPIAGVNIMAYGEGSMPAHPESVSDEQGKFELLGLEPGRYMLAGEGERHRGTARRPIELGLADRSLEVVLEVEPALLIEGKVEIESSGEPCQRGRALLGPAGPLTIAVAEAAERAAQDDVITVSAQIEPDGRVRFKGVPPGRYHVMVQCLHHVYASGPGLVDAAEQTQALRWKVAPGAGLLVRVVDATRNAVPSARLSLELPERHGRRALMPLRVDEHGISLTPRNMQPGSYRIHPDAVYGVPPIDVEVPRTGGVRELTITLPGSAQLAVRVQDERGQPVDDVRIVATRLELAPARTVEGAVPSTTLAATPLGRGQYRISPLAAGSYRVEAHDAENPPVLLSAALTLRGSEHASLQAVVDRSAVIRGRVIDEQGAPVANAWISASFDSADARAAEDRGLSAGHGVGFSRVLSDDEGTFRLERLAKAAVYRVRAEKHHGGATELSGIRVGTAVSIRLPAPGILQGWVQTKSGQPVTSFDISASSAELPDLVHSQHVVSKDGKFRFDGVPAGKVHIQALSADGTQAQQLVQLAPNQTLDGIHLSLAVPPEPSPAPEQSAPKPSPASSDEVSPPGQDAEHTKEASKPAQGA